MTDGGPGVGERAPYFRAMAAGSGREVSSRTCAGKKLVLIFHDRTTAWVAEEINRAVRKRYPSPDEVVVASVLDLSLVPPIYWLTASTAMGQAYGWTAGKVPSGVAPAQHHVLIQDWGGPISRRFGVRGTDRDAAIVVVDEDAEISGFYRGGAPVEAAPGMLED